MKKLCLSLLFLVLFVFLSACGGGAPSTSSGEKANEATAQVSQSGTVTSGLDLKEFEDWELGYTMHCPNERTYTSGYSKFWIISDENGGDSYFIVFSEYNQEAFLCTDEMAAEKDPLKLLDHFMPIMQYVIGQTRATSLRESELDIIWSDISVAGLSAAEFRGKIGSNKSGELRDLGITGICIVGEKRPYVFWAVDLSENQNCLVTAQEILRACVASFKEGR